MSFIGSIFLMMIAAVIFIYTPHPTPGDQFCWLSALLPLIPSYSAPHYLSLFLLILLLTLFPFFSFLPSLFSHVRWTHPHHVITGRNAGKWVTRYKKRPTTWVPFARQNKIMNFGGPLAYLILLSATGLPFSSTLSK